MDFGLIFLGIYDFVYESYAFLIEFYAKYLFEFLLNELTTHEIRIHVCEIQIYIIVWIKLQDLWFLD